MSVFSKKKAKNKIFKIKVEEGDLKRIDIINKKLSELDGDQVFNIEEKLYDNFISLINSAEKELSKTLKNSINEQKKTE